MVVDAEDGHELKRLLSNDGPHNTIASLDGRFVYGVSETNFWVFDARSDSIVRQIGPVGESGVFPFTVNSANSMAYICLGKHVGCDVVDLKQGRVLHRILAGDEPIAHRTHGAALTPDERELWLSDQDGKKLFVFDATKRPPAPKGRVELSRDGHGWVCFSLDGAFAWSHTPDVIDVKTKQIVATLKDEEGKPVCGSKFFEAHFRDGKLVRVGNQFGLGRRAEQ
jgi:DNA-binding beta-propeller fold protein YncE